MGLDLGDKTIGVALSDPFFITAQPHITIRRKKTSEDIEKLKDIIDQYQVEKIVLGLPKNMNNTLGPQGQKVVSFADILRKKTQKEVIYQDERLTTIQSERVLMNMKVRRENRKKYIDKIAAAFILQTFLDRS